MDKTSRLKSLFTSLALTTCAFLALPASEARADAAASYKKMCASCHGADGSGKPAMAKALKIDPKLLNLGRPESAGLSRDQLKAIIAEGKNKMPAYKAKLGAADLDAVTDYSIQLATALRKK
jgi:mono/diheme cytochrome c family protein